MLDDLKKATLNADGIKWGYELYQTNKTANTHNLITFFVADDGIDIIDLQRYREATQTECLIAINTTGKDYDCLKIADNVIDCLPNEIELAIYSFACMGNGDGFMGIDWNDIRTAVYQRKSIKFIHCHAKGEDCVVVACEKLISKLKVIKSDKALKSLMVSTFADDSFDFEKQYFITEKISKISDVDEANIFYQIIFTDEFLYWQHNEQGCCICLHLVYSDIPNVVEPI